MLMAFYYHLFCWRFDFAKVRRCDRRGCHLRVDCLFYSRTSYRGWLRPRRCAFRNWPNVRIISANHSLFAPHRNARRGLLLAVAAMLLFGALAEGFDFYPYVHQAVLIAAVGTLPQIWLEWSSIRNWRKLLLLIAGLLAIPLGYEVWSYANIGIVKLKAQSVAQGEPYCILLSNGNPFYGRYYHVAPDNLSLAGANMVAPHGVGGSGDCCQWDFHALLLTKNDQMFNWSYNSQRFDRISAKTRRDLGIAKLNCP
uniref:Uncharacterized protein n=1 Tax=Rhodopseudomonas palustris (strain BisA53) TaxID=316055 RepID=Q07P17_RHOP5